MQTWACLSIKLGVMLAMATIVSSCGLKTGVYNLNQAGFDVGIDEEPLRYWEGEFISPRLWDRVDFTLGFDYNDGEEEGHIPGHSHIPQFEIDTWDVRLAGRVFPLGVQGLHVVPYLSGGLGYYELNVHDWYVDHVDVFDDRYYVYDWDRDTSTVSSGVFPFAAAGFYVPILNLDDHAPLQMALQGEFRYDFDKADGGIDMEGYQIMIGVAIMWK